MFCKLSGVECAMVGKGDVCPLFGLVALLCRCPLACDEDWSDESPERGLSGVLTVRIAPHGEQVGIRCTLSNARRLINADVFHAGVWEDACNRVYL